MSSAFNSAGSWPQFFAWAFAGIAATVMWMRIRTWLSLAAATASVVLVASACGTGPKNNGFGSSGGGDPSDGGFFDSQIVLGESETGPSGVITCSADLKSILRDGVVQERCPDDKGCAAGACVPACDAAAVNKSSIGCDYVVVPPTSTNTSQSCLVAFIANTWGAPVKLSVTYGTQVLAADAFTAIPQGSGSAITYTKIVGGMIPPGKVAMAFLSVEGSNQCPGGIVPARSNLGAGGTGLRPGFRLKTTAPVVGYDIYPYGGGSSAVTSATLLIPTSAWGTNYIGTTAYPANTGSPWIGIAAAQDNTTVTIRPKVAIAGGAGVAAAAANVVTTYKLNAGEYLKLEQLADLTGSPIDSDKPVGAWGGNTCAQVPTGITYCDGLHQQLPPVKSFGYRYSGVHYRDRYAPAKESPPYRIIGAVDGTILKFTPAVPGAPSAIAAGQVVEFRAQDAFVVEGQDDKHPFYLGSYMTSCAAAAGFTNLRDCRGDPEFVNVIPDAQYLASYTFFTDPTYPETNLVFIRNKAKDGKFKDVTLDCAGALTGWTAIPGTDSEWVRRDLVTGNFARSGTCDNGYHTATSDAPFGLTVWGWGSAASSGFFSTAVSYGYPAGASILPINTVEVPAVPK